MKIYIGRSGSPILSEAYAFENESFRALRSDLGCLTSPTGSLE